MIRIQQLLKQLAAQEADLLATQFLAPCLPRGRVQTSLSGLIYTFRVQPQEFEGWGIFEPLNATTAQVIEEASFSQIEGYLQLFLSLRVYLIRSLQGSTWLAYPMNSGDMQQKVGGVKPIPVHLVAEGIAFLAATIRWDGRLWWFEALDRRADPFMVEKLKQAIEQNTLPEDLSLSGLTPELRTAYDLVTQEIEDFSPQRRDERRLRQALAMGGGELQEFADHNGYWRVEWSSADGERHTSAISKQDLTVMSAGICLSGQDQDFDLQSLVGVVEGQRE
jgi:hypothetical protein